MPGGTGGGAGVVVDDEVVAIKPPGTVGLNGQGLMAVRCSAALRAASVSPDP